MYIDISAYGDLPRPTQSSINCSVGNPWQALEPGDKAATASWILITSRQCCSAYEAYEGVYNLLLGA